MRLIFAALLLATPALADDMRVCDAWALDRQAMNAAVRYVDAMGRLQSSMTAIFGGKDAISVDAAKFSESLSKRIDATASAFEENCPTP